MSRYDIAIGKKYSEPKLTVPDFQKEIATRISHQRGVECKITITDSEREYMGSFINCSQGWAQNQDVSLFNLIVEIDGFIAIDQFFGKRVNKEIYAIEYFYGTQEATFICYVQDISSTFNIENNSTQIRITPVWF